MLDVHDRWPAFDVSTKVTRLQSAVRIVPGPLAAAMANEQDHVGRSLRRLFARDTALWSADERVQRTIANRLGWLSSPEVMADALPRLESFASSILRDGFTDVVLLGMGGSSLAPEVLRAVLGPEPGWPRLHVIDSTDPAAIRAVATPPKLTVYVLASKSGTTIEPNALAAHFRERLEASRAPRWADHFVAITDEQTPLAERARAEGFREIFINPTDIGGRYSALSYFGLVPAALMGHDVSALLGWGLAMLDAARAEEEDVRTNPAAALALVVGAAARAGRDKLTLLLPAELAPFGLWIEQLVAESTGKQGTGIVPIAGESIGARSAYGEDRVFVHMLTPETTNEEREKGRGLAASGPSIEIELPELAALGAEFMRWEIATAIAGAMLEINPFDEPNVQQAKDATRVLLDRYASEHRISWPSADRTLDSGAILTLSTAARTALGQRGPDALLTLLGNRDYFGVLAYLGPDPEIAEMLQDLRTAVRDRTRAATMVGFGPRYLHSTGQLHKGGPNSGVFLVITAAIPEKEDLAIPDQPFTFATLEQAQALGDFNSLDTAGRRALLVRLPEATSGALKIVASLISEVRL